MPEPLLTWKGRRIRSPGDGPAAAARKVPTAPLRPGSLFFVPSPLEGWGLEVLLDRLGADSVVVVYEKDQELTEACSAGWASHWSDRAPDPRLFVLAADTEQAVQALFRQLPLSTLRRCEFLALNGAWMLHGPRYREVFQRLDDGLVRWWSNRMTSLYLGNLWVRNLFDNLGAPSFTLEPWPHWGTDPVLVCGAGLSLEGALPWAAEHREGLRIVAADTALAVLRDAGIVPDAVVCLESQHANLRDFSGWSGAEVMLFTDLTSHPPGTRVFSTKPRWFVTEFAELSLWERLPWSPEALPVLPPLGSVGVAAAWVAWRLSRGQIILAGLDFSFPPGQSHARGAPALKALAARTDRYLPMEQVAVWEKPGVRRTPSGWLTTPVMEGYAGILADQARAEASRTWVWDSDGLPLGLETWPRTRLARGVTNTPSPPGSVATSALGWLAEEAERWRTVLRLLERINKGNTDQPTWDALKAALAEVDYLTFDFPDPTYRAESDWLIRAQHRARWLLERTSRLLPT